MNRAQAYDLGPARYPAGAVVLGIDGGDLTGFAARDVATGARIVSGTIAIRAAGFSQRDAIDSLDAALRGLPWIVAVEKTFRPRGRKGTPPTYAEQFWLAAIDLYARERALLCAGRFRKPTVVRPSATDWRSALGIRIRAIRGTTLDERRADLKGAATAWLREVLREDISQPDEAEAAAIAAWLVRLARLGCVKHSNRAVDIYWTR